LCEAKKEAASHKKEPRQTEATTSRDYGGTWPGSREHRSPNVA